jgi:hypothetical protein
MSTASARAFRVHRQFDGLDRVIRTGTGNHGYAPFGRFDGHFDDPFMFFVRKSGALARGSAGHQAMGTFADLPLDQSLEGRFVYRSMGKRRNQCGY